MSGLRESGVAALERPEGGPGAGVEMNGGAVCPAASETAEWQAPWGRASSPGSAAWRGRIIAVTSGKGGVGKSNVAAGLSVLLGAAGARVALVDADLGLGNLDILLGVSPPATLADVLASRKDVGEVLVDLRHGVRLAAGGSVLRSWGMQPPGRRRALLDGLAALGRQHDVVVLDCGSGLSEGVTDFCNLADHVLAVTTPEPTSMTDTYAVVKWLAVTQHPGRVSLLVNLAASRGEAKAVYARIATVTAQFLGRTVYDAGYVLADTKVPAAVRAREPFVVAFPRCPASVCLMALAAKLRPEGAGEMQESRGGFFRRFLGLRSEAKLARVN